MWSNLGSSEAGLAERIIARLQTQQHLHPHQTLLQGLWRVQIDEGLDGEAARRAMVGLNLDGQRKIGRLRGCELAQLARTIVRLTQAQTHAQLA